MRRVATVILNRNLAEVTNLLCDHLQQYDGDITDIFVVEAGSEHLKTSKYITWHANWPEAMRHGLRYSRGMNYGLSQLWKEDKFKHYDAFFLLTNDTELECKQTLLPLMNILDQHKRVGILSPCSRRWGERLLFKNEIIKYFWFIHNNAYLLRKEFIEAIHNTDEPAHLNFLFDGSNFRGYGSESELIAKAYANDWAAAITNSVWASENESYLIEKANLIRTEGYEENLQLYIEEGKAWMRKKYGFNSHWSMQQYVKNFYDNFFDFHPELTTFKI
jgi:hypothetical protein